MTSWVELGNLALSRLGDFDFITSLDDEQKSAQLIKKNYSTTARALLRQHTWNFALSRTVLAPSASSSPAFGTGKYFDIPPECLRVLKDPENLFLQFSLESAAGKRVIYFDGTAFNLYSINNITDPNLFDSVFVDCYAAHLAKDICMGLTANSKLYEILKDDAKKLLRDARSLDGSETGVQLQYADDFINAR